MPTFDSFQTLLDQATGVQPATPTDTKTDVLDRAGQIKKNQVAQASARKQEAMGPGVDSAYNIALSKLSSLGTLGRSDKENDLREMTPGQLYQKYGDQAGTLIKQVAQGTNAVMDTMNTPDRNAGQVAYDGATDIASGFGNALGGIAALGVGTVSSRGGAAISRELEEATRLNAAYQSDELRVRKQLAEDKNALAGRDNVEQRATDISNGDSELIAGLKSIGRETVNAVSIAGSDPAVLGSGVSNAVGSLLAAGPVSKGVSGLAGLAKLGDIGSKIATPVAIGAMESGGSYTQTVNDVMGRSHDQLLAESEDYRELVKTMSPDDAKLELANSTALKAAALTAPAAIAAGKLVSKFEGAPLSTMIRKAPGYVLKEPVEEGIQGASGQLAQNLAIQGSVDENQDLAEGVGRQAGEGALYGLGMTAVMGAPSGVVQAVGLAGKGTLAAGKAALGMMADRVDKQLQANKEASPLADKTVLAAATEAQATAGVEAPVMRQAVEETDATPEQKAEANSYIDSLVAANTYDVEADATPELLKPIMGDVKNRVEAIQRVAQYVNTVEEGSPAQMEAGVYLYDLVNGYQKLINSDPEALQKVPQDHPARTIVGQYVGLMDSLGKTPKVMDAIGKIQSALEKRAAKAVEITDEMLETPEGQKAVNDVINVAILAPEKGNLETTERVLNQVSRGKLQISPEQKAALDTSVAMLRAVAAADKEAQALGETDPVSLNISSVEGEKGPSLTQHAKGIMSAWKAGDRNTAAARLVEFHNFAKGMSNKLGAINTHFAAGDPKAVGVGYKIYVGGNLKDSPNVWRVYPNNVGSIKMAQKVGREAKMLADVYNNLVTAFPDLKGDHLDFIPLDPRLGIPAEEFVANHGKTTTPAEDAKTDTKAVPSGANDTRIPAGVSSLSNAVLATRLGNTNTNDPRYEIYQAEMDRREDAATLAEQQVAEKIAKAKEKAAIEETPKVVEKSPAVEKEAKPADKPAVTPVEEEVTSLASELEQVGGLAQFLGVRNTGVEPGAVPTLQQITDSLAGLLKALSEGAVTKQALASLLSWVDTSQEADAKRMERATYKKTDAKGEALPAEQVEANKAKYAERVALKAGTPRQYLTMQVAEELIEVLEAYLQNSDLAPDAPIFKLLEAQKRILKEYRFGAGTLVKDGGSPYNGLKNYQAVEKALEGIDIPVAWRETGVIEADVQALLAEEIKKLNPTMQAVTLAKVAVEAQPQPTTVSKAEPTETGSKTPEFDKLPSYDENNPSFTYAGIGSRQTPQAIQDLMTTLAERLSELGFTLMSGNAKGADQAFEAGVGKNSKEIFLVKDATDTTRAIAKEIHPSPNSLGDYALDLMARNTNQLFGKYLKLPVDFVLAWTPDGLEKSADRSIKSGGTGQAIDMASRKGIPVFNLATPDGLARFEAHIQKLESAAAAEGKAKPVEVIIVEESLEDSDSLIDFDAAMQEATVRDDAPMFMLEDTTTEAPAAPVVPTSVDMTQKLDVEMDEVPLTKEELDVPIMEAPIDDSGEGVAALFPRIMGVIKGVFSTSYKLPKVQKTRTIGTETPISFLRSALSNSANFTNLIGSSPKGKYDAKTAAEYGNLLDRAEEIVEKLKQNLANKLATDYKKGAKGTTIRELALGLKQIKTAKGVVYDPFRAADTKSMGITEQLNNTLEYNPELLEGAVLAGIQWFIDSDTRSDNLDEADVASMTGIDRAFVSSSMVDAMNTGTSLLDAKAALSSKILNYWGLSKENSGPIGYQSGVPEAIAGEIMRTFKEFGWLNADYYGVTKGGQFVKYDADGKAPLEMVKTLIQIRTEPLSKDSAVRAYPNALDMAVLIEPEEKTIIGDEGELAVSPTQMRNPDVKNTPQQLKTIANEQNTPYFLNLPMVNLFTAMGIDELKEAFVQVDTKNTLMNKNHRMSVEGQTQALASAFQSLTDTANRVDGYAEGGPLDQVPIRYAFNMSRVSRLQMLGKYTPQSNKLIREAIMPTRSVLDLTNAKDLFRFQLGLAQALGIKVHHKMPSAIKKDLAKRLDALAPTVQILESWVEKMGGLPTSLTPTMISNFKEAGIALTPVALHALVEKARYNKGMSLNAFNTAIYVEADGISNGPINAMMLFTVGGFTAQWLKTIAKGGMFIGHDRMTMNEHFTTTDAVDLYKTTANIHLKKMATLRKKLLKVAPDVAGQMDQLLVLMDLFMGSDMSFKEGVLTIDRGLTKNPLTITLYGSGAKGIAGNLVQSLTDALYERMSQTIEATSNQGMSPAEAMFGKQSSSLEEAQEKYAKFEKAFEALTTKVAVLNEDVGYALESVPETKRSEKESSLIEFTLSQQELSALRNNMHLLFVTPLTYAIKDTVGDSLLETTKLLRKATQVQSIFLAHAFKAELAKVLLEKGKDPLWNRNDFLTVEEVNKIKASIAHLAPNIVTEDQVFSIATGLVSPVGATTFGSALDGSFRSDPYLHAPKNAGVSGIPYMTIGAGDGLMMQLISTYSDAIEGTLKIFDGMNMPLDKIEEGSRQANAAVFESWSRNPLKAVYESYLAFTKVADTETLFEEMRPELTLALIGFTKEPVSYKRIMSEFNALPNMLNWAQQSIEARHRTVKKVNLSVDQMAAVGEPHVNKGTVVLDNSSYEAMEAQINVIYEEELADINKAERVDRTLNAELLLLTESHASGVEVLPASRLGELTTQMPKTQAAVMKEIIDTLAAEGYRIVFGGPEQIAKFNDAEGLYGNGGNSSEGLQGYTNIDSKVIYLHNNTTETFTHELIHAATFQAVLAHYLGTGTRRASMAVLRIEELMNQFLDLESSLIQVNSDVRDSYADAKAAIEDYLLDDTPGSKAAALNEFMAWTLANESLANIAKNTTATKFARIREAVLSFLKQLFNIKQEVGKDMLSNLLFNSTILIRSQPTVKERFTRTVLMQNSIYGDNDRLVSINESLNKTIGQYLKEKVHPNKVDATVALQTGIMQSYRVSQSFMAHGFDMNMQEASTFNTIVATLATEAKIDANAMATAQKLYVHAMKNLSYVDFMADPESTDPNVEALAREKFDVLSGKYLVAKDGLGRSTLLPAFLALATVNNEFRAVLAKVPVPKNTHNNAGTLDALLENTGNRLTGKLSNRMSGISKNSTNTQEAIDDLNTHIGNIIETRETFFDQVASKSGGLIDRSNEIVTNGMSLLSRKLITLAKKSEKPGTNKVLKFAAQASTGLAAVLDEEIAGAVADNLQGAINKTNMWTPVREMLGEFIGRTDSNANVYDMIKAVLTTVQQTRQQYREHLPVLIREKFSRELSSEEWGGLHRVLAKGDITALRDNYTNAELLKLMVSPSAVNKAIDDLQNQLKNTDSANYALLDEKMRQLAQFMVDGVPQKALLRNATAISRLLMTGVKSGFTSPASVKQIDSLVSLYALQNQSKDDMASLRTLAQDENAGLTFVLSYLDGQRKGEASKEATAAARLNVYKGYIPSQSNSESSIQVFDDSKYSELVAKSFERIGDYVGSSVESNRNRGYYYLPVASRSTFEQGIIQNVRETIGGVDATTGQTVAQTAGVIANPIAVRRILSRIKSDTNVESLMPVFDADGDVVAFERSLNPAMMERLGTESDLSKMLGVWRGRQVEESFARNYNETLINHLGAMLDKDLAESANNINEYVDLNKTKDPVLMKAVSLFSPATKKYAEQVFHGKFMVRKDMLNDVLGYHAATVGDFWTGNGRWSPETQKAVRNIAVSVFGNAAYRKLVTAESVLQNVVSDARVLIVIKSVIVPMANLLSNVYQLISRGVPLASITKGMGKKVAEIEAYTHARLREIEAEAELRAASGNAILERRLKTELQSIKDSYTRMSIWPLIKAGEFSGISDAGLLRADVDLTSGRLQAYIEQAAAKLPGSAATVGRYALVTKDTALFQGLQKAVEYGDFLAKAILYDDLTQRKGLSEAAALARITEEFVNYSRLSGRFRGALENNGILWFYNFKLRIVKIALSTIRNNPVHALLATVAPAPTTFGSVGMPTSDNFFTKLLEGTLDNSVGPGQALDSLSLNPWVNLTQ
jgi:hypothetical protein